MPGSPPPIIDPRYGAHWTTVTQAIRLSQQQIQQQRSGASQVNVLDQYGNTVVVNGTNLNQIVTIGAAFQQPGVLVGTGLAAGTAGSASQQHRAIATISTTKNSTSATLSSGTGFVVGYVIGAADVSDPSSGQATPAITPGTTIAAITGTSVTLSQMAAETGTALYCACCQFVVLT